MVHSDEMRAMREGNQKRIGKKETEDRPERARQEWLSGVYLYTSIYIRHDIFPH